MASAATAAAAMATQVYELHVRVVKARNLKNVTLLGKMDPYVICRVEVRPSIERATATQATRAATCRADRRR